MKFKLAGFVLILMMVVLVISGCAQSAVSAGGAEPTEVVEDIAPGVPEGKIAADSLPCPQEAEGMQFFAEEAHGYCVLVPDTFSVERPLDDEVIFQGPVPQSGGQALGFIVVADVQGQSTAEFAAPLIAEAENMGMTVVQSTITLSGEEALVVEGLPGQDISRQVFVVHGGMLYRMTFVPDDASDEGFESMQALYDAVIGSFAFLR
jgi:hypothetical protein